MEKYGEIKFIIEFSFYELTWILPKFVMLFKGQLIPKCFFDVFKFFQKTNENKSTWGIIGVKLNFDVCFLEEWGYVPKKYFWN